MAMDWSATRPGETAQPLPDRQDAHLVFIGAIRTPFATRDQCPRQGDAATGPVCRVEIDPLWQAALAGIEAFGHLDLLYWMHEARRDLVTQTPRGGEPLGTFALRSPVRPNPIALSRVALLGVEGATLLVRGLDCLDGTPLLDIKPNRCRQTPPHRSRAMRPPDRRLVLAGLATLAAPRIARAATVGDGAGREVTVPARVERIFPAGPPAAIQLYTLAPDLLIGWPRANRPEELPFLLPGIGDRPEIGRITGRGNSANLEAVLTLKPDLIIDAGSTGRTYVELADRVQGQTGIPYALIDGRFEAIPAGYRILGRLTGRSERAETLARWCETAMATIKGRIATIPAAERPSVYYARGPRGLETGLGGSINVETLSFLGARNVAAEQPGNGLAQVSLEQVLAWNPEIIVTIDLAFSEAVRRDPAWADIAAVKAGRVHLSPKLPFGWVDFPPSVNRMIGLWWLARLLYPRQFPEDIRPIAREFHTLFYQVTPSEAQLDLILSGRG